MPQGEKFWNPYRWVTVSSQPVQHAEPKYQHTFDGISGRLWCELKALTPLLIGDGGRNNVQFVRHKRPGNQNPYIPSTSLKGAIRSLAEVVGNATVPFSIPVDPQHALANARKEVGGVSQFDTVARTFGYWREGDSNILTGLIHFSDAEITTEVAPPNDWQQFTVDVGQPKPSHKAFYPKNNQGENNRRKFYHHHPNATELSRAQADQTRNVRPAPPGTGVSFTVDFTNLRDDELNLLLYCLALEEQVSVTLSTDALGPDAQESVTLDGPLRHKIGGAKPHGAGSVQIRITKLELHTDAKARYQGRSSTQTFQEQDLFHELNSRTASFRGRTDQTMRELRAMLIYTAQDPRQPIHYPDYDWFLDERDAPGANTLLKTTI